MSDRIRDRDMAVLSAPVGQESRGDVSGVETEITDLAQLVNCFRTAPSKEFFLDKFRQSRRFGALGSQEVVALVLEDKQLAKELEKGSRTLADLALWLPIEPFDSHPPEEPHVPKRPDQRAQKSVTGPKKSKKR